MPDATERKALWLCTFVGGCIALAPMEWVSAGTLMVTAALLFSLHRFVTNRENALQKQLDAWAPPLSDAPR